MPERTRNEALAALLVEAHWSATQLAKAVNTLGAAQELSLRYDRSSVAHWLAGARPRRPVPDIVAAALSRRIGRLISAQATGMLQSSHSIAIPAFGMRRASPVEQILDLLRQDGDSNLRTPLSRTPFSVASLAVLPWSASEQAPTPADGDLTTAAQLETHNDMIASFTKLADWHGGRLVRPLVVAYLRDSAVPVLVKPRPATGQDREVFTAAAQFVHILAGMSDDSGYHGLAQLYYLSALELARAAGNARQFAIGLRAMSTHALRLRLPRQALDLADMAVAVLGGRGDGAAQAFLLSQRAHARACAGRFREARADLVAAERHQDRASSSAGPFFGYPRAALNYQRYQTLGAMQESKEAISALQASAHDRAQTDRRRIALTLARLAEVHLAVGQLDEGLRYAHSFLRAYPHMHSAHVDTARRRLSHALARYPVEPQARALAERMSSTRSPG
ncbi:hypothetical protein NX794_31020 [Streptomyces sp. LP11]|uniref:Transcriptional regulator n=1 Tax=Streptomyces pyxinicus TaxID=2970331 RepID=A0ABT2BAQ3_9ACTN|nr:hypothetical protein [Streptomyces sp. LP11]MCS0605601.1 hypothetical protein [Streptomyces sp. LP11]